MYSFPNLEPVCCSMSSSNCCFLTCIQISQEAGQVVWYSRLLKTFPQCAVTHTVRGFGINKSSYKSSIKQMFFWNCFSYDPADVGNLTSVSSAFSKSGLNIWKFSVHRPLKPRLEDSATWISTSQTQANTAKSVVWPVQHVQARGTKGVPSFKDFS